MPDVKQVEAAVRQHHTGPLFSLPSQERNEFLYGATCLSKINKPVRLAETVYDTPSPAKILGREETKSGGALTAFRTVQTGVG